MIKRFALLFTIVFMLPLSTYAGSNPCNGDCVDSKINQANPTIGTGMQGGIVGGTRATGCPATLIVQQTNAAENIVLADGDAATNLIAGATSRTDGSANTQAIINYTDGIPVTEGAAFTCANSTVGGFTDWYLPSIGELLCILNNNLSLPNITPADGVTYWSSTQATTGMDINGSVYVIDNNGSTFGAEKLKNDGMMSEVMCIRRAT